MINNKNTNTDANAQLNNTGESVLNNTHMKNNNLKLIKTIDINAKEWYDKINGNSYFAGYVVVNKGTKSENIFIMRFQYGYGEQYLHEGIKMVVDYYDLSKNIVRYKGHALSFFRENNIQVNHKIKENCLQRELKNVGYTKEKYNNYVA